MNTLNKSHEVFLYGYIFQWELTRFCNIGMGNMELGGMGLVIVKKKNNLNNDTIFVFLLIESVLKNVFFSNI